MTYPHTAGSADGLSINGYDGVSICTGGNTRTERLRVALNGDVGIGTTSPEVRLHIAESDGNSAHRTLLWSSHRSNNNTYPKMGYLGSASAYASGALGLFANTVLGGTEDETVRIQGNGDTYFNGGNVGIGTTSPIQKLTVDGNLCIFHGNNEQNAGNGLIFHSDLHERGFYMSPETYSGGPSSTSGAKLRIGYHAKNYQLIK